MYGSQAIIYILTKQALSVIPYWRSITMYSEVQTTYGIKTGNQNSVSTRSHHGW